MDIKDSYLHGTVGVVKSISVSADKLKYTLADIAGTVREVTLPVATLTANGLLSKEDKKKLDNMIATKIANDLILKINSGTTEDTSLYTYNGSSAKTLDIKSGTGIGFTNNAGSLQIYNSGVRSIATGTTNGTISVNTNGTSADVVVKGLGSAAYKETNNFLWIGHKPSNMNGSNTHDLNNSYDSDCIIHDYQWTNGPNNKINSVINLVYLSDWKNQLAFTPSLTTISYRSYSGSAKSWSNWKTIAFTDSNITGNAATADKLKTQRKLWGLDFDGTTDVKGTITIGGGLTNGRSIQFPGGEFFDVAGNFYLDGTNEVTNSFNIFKTNTDGTNTHLFNLSENKGANFYGTLTAPTFMGNLDGTYVNKLTGYQIATARGAVAASDSLNTALGKLEYKAYLGETAYDWYKSVTGTDNDDIINKWEEIVDFIDSVKEGTDILDEFVTRKTDLTIIGTKIFSNNDYGEQLVIHRALNNADSVIRFSNEGDGLLGCIGIGGSASGSCPLNPYWNDGTNVYKFWHSGNDGLGSGLDADLLDGNHSSAFFKYINQISSNIDANTIRGNGIRFNTTGNGSNNSNVPNTYGFLIQFDTDRTPMDYGGILIHLTPGNILKVRSHWDSRWKTWTTILGDNNYTDYVNSTNFPGLAGVRSVTINSTYLRVNTNGTNTDLTIPYATTATHVEAGGASNDVFRHVWFSHDPNETQRVYDDKFMYNPRTNVLTAIVTNVLGGGASTDVNRHIWFSHASVETLRVSDDSFMYNPATKVLTVGAISGSASKLGSTTIVSSKAFSLVNTQWIDVKDASNNVYTFANLASGTYAIQITCGNLVASGIMSVYKNITDTALDEIPLHVYHDSSQPWRPYLRTSGNKLLISSNDATATSRTVTIKIALIL